MSDLHKTGTGWATVISGSSSELVDQAQQGLLSEGTTVVQFDGRPRAPVQHRPAQRPHHARRPVLRRPGDPGGTGGSRLLRHAPEPSLAAPGEVVLPPTSTLAIETRGLSKLFGGVPAVDGIDLAVPVGVHLRFPRPQRFGQDDDDPGPAGPFEPQRRGAGHCWARPMPERGMATLPRVGALVEGPAFYPWLSGHDNLARIDAMGPDGQSSTREARIGEALARVGLSAAAKKKYKAYSLGMRQRLGLASALLRPRQLLVLDEPTNGMDPQGTREIRHLIRQLGEEGSTVFLSSHLLSEIEQVCSHVGVMHRGKLLMQGMLEDLRASAVPKLRVEADDPARAGELLAGLGMADVAREGNQVVGTLNGLAPEDCCRHLVEAGIGVRMLIKEQRSLEDAFVALTGEGFNVAG